MSFRVLSVVVAAGAALAAASGSQVASQGKPLDYETFKSRVEPIFLERREGHVRCYVCHSENNNGLHLQRLSDGATTWDDEQSRKNFESVSGLVAPNDPASSRLLIHPLAPEAGGDLFHSGGRQFEVQERPGLEDPGPMGGREIALQKKAAHGAALCDLGGACRAPHPSPDQFITNVLMRFGTSPTGMTALTFMLAVSMAVTDRRPELAM